MASMDAMDVCADSAAAIERGNNFLSKRNFAEAEKAYREAARLDPEDGVPWSNISAIQYDQGDYSSSLSSIEKALSLLSSEPEDGPTKQRLLTRMAKCQLNSLSLDAAENTIDRLNDDMPGNLLYIGLLEMQEFWSTAPKEPVLRKQILDRLPRYKAHLQDAPEYYPMGHDVAEPLRDEQLREAVGPQGNLSFLMCGSGDARHLFVSFIDLFLGSGRGGGFRKAYFTIVDLNAAALARTLVVFDMIFIYAVYKAQKLPRLEDALSVIAYTFSSAFVPSFAVDKMLESVKTLIDEIEKDTDPNGSEVLGMFYLPNETRSQVLRKLKQWAEPLGNDFSPEKLRASVLARQQAAAEGKKELYGEDHLNKSKPNAKQCQQDFRDFGVVFAEKAFVERRDPALVPLLDAHRSGNPGAKEAVGKHIDAHWKTNPTVLDMDYEPRRKDLVEPGGSSWDLTPPLDWDPTDLFEFMGSSMGIAKDDDSLLQVLGRVFDMVAISTLSLSQRIHIEVIAGEMSDVMERIRYNSLKHRSHKPQKGRSIDPTLFPRQYDRIHMSNIPDYIGGPLTAHLYGGPLLRTDRPSNLRFNNLLNPPMFESHDQFVAEYMLMYDSEHVADHFGLVRQNDPSLSPEKQAFVKAIGLSPFAAENYFIWSRSGIERVPQNRMMPRPYLEHWLYGHLLKICLPHDRPQWSGSPIHAPLNLTAFFRLVAHMYEVGYPAHWLCAILHSPCEGYIKTTARPPSQVVMDTEDLDVAHPLRKISLGPWKAELSTLMSLWRGLLPFGVSVPPQTLAPLEEIVECSVTFPEFSHQAGRVPHFALVFFDASIVRKRVIRLPAMIRDDEKGDTSEFAGRFRDKGVHLITTFKYVTDTRTATFWMRKDVVSELLKGDSWRVAVCRTDTWELIVPTTSAPPKVLRPLRPWTRT